VAGYARPPRSVASIVTSLAAHSKYFPLETEATGAEFEEAIDKYLEAWPKDVVAGAPLMGVEEVYESFARILSGGFLNGDSSPGYPGLMMATENNDFLALYGAEKFAAVLTERLILLNSVPVDEFKRFSSMDLVRLGLCDPVRLFVKNEPHKVSKLKAGRYRLIASLSLADQCIERHLQGPQNRREIANFQSIPSMSGMGNHDSNDAGIAETERRINRIEDKAGTDASAFDWTQDHKMLMADATIRARFLELHPWENPFVKRQLCLMRSVFILDDGSLIEQTLPGIQKSGSYGTSSGNSRNRTIARLVAFPEHPIFLGGKPCVGVMGDDCVESIPKEDRSTALARYARLGVLIKEITTIEDNGYVEFCGMNYYGDRVENPRGLKAVVKFLYTWPSKESWDMRRLALVETLRYSPEKVKYLSLIDAVRTQLVEGANTSN